MYPVRTLDQYARNRCAQKIYFRTTKTSTGISFCVRLAGFKTASDYSFPCLVCRELRLERRPRLPVVRRVLRPLQIQQQRHLLGVKSVGQFDSAQGWEWDGKWVGGETASCDRRVVANAM